MTVRIAVARAAEPLVVPTKPSSLGTHGANLSMGVVELRHEIGARVRALADQYGAVSATLSGSKPALHAAELRF